MNLEREAAKVAGNVVDAIPAMGLHIQQRHLAIQEVQIVDMKIAVAIDAAPDLRPSGQQRSRRLEPALGSPRNTAQHPAGSVSKREGSTMAFERTIRDR